MTPWFTSTDSVADCQRKSPLDGLEARILLSHVSGLSRIQLITQSTSLLNPTQIEALNQLTAKRVAGEPLAYLVGEREFFGLNFHVTPAVLIPRPDTELLVELALQFTPEHGSLIDMGTGSGAIAISIASERPDLHICASDLSPAALEIATMNAARLLTPARISFYQSDWFQQLPAIRFHTIVSNPPYIVKDDHHLSQGDLRFEPINALTDHADGLSAYRTIIGNAKEFLLNDGMLLMEHGYDQSESVQALLASACFQEIQSWPDLAGILRVTGGRWKGQS
ncbi:peptide chain release factor N(5)-glutamine methyltransferase [Undibacterium fentianense]|uniref:Release factor glutamine methyltransferase n=1 Tax=Undibacterium fentianense TaxID=2828728 RepID=A0A941E588_9BURK|nr:peptide chain release factor N(5)-glutamine methyltransferase [Undibacterium fentianense]MBR7800864.1 peptide chain release factor N(5)-glutamine methyltransferase [Undibacterium fentianense]